MLVDFLQTWPLNQHMLRKAIPCHERRSVSSHDLQKASVVCVSPPSFYSHKSAWYVPRVIREFTGVNSEEMKESFQPPISIVIPAFDEENGIGPQIETIRTALKPLSWSMRNTRG